jgi:hypothetical protein
MKNTIFFAAILSILFTACGSNEPEFLEVKNPETGVKIKVQIKDLENTMTWNEATKACAKIGEGWRLPTKEEQELINQELHQKGKGSFKSGLYWSGTDNDEMENSAWTFDFENGGNSSNLKGDPLNVRAVRNF